ncbi:MAG: STAS domain-containing protein [Planctomycetaceae bacterium]|nr:STAS domain-containing protein [Planctomycetaceae bacterium]
MPLNCEFSTVKALPAVAIVALRGAIDPITISELQKSLLRVSGKGFRTLVLDLGEIRYINSAGLSYLVNLSDQLNARGGALLLANAQPKVKVVFDLMGVGQFFKLHKTVGAALVTVAEGRRKRLRRQA